MRTRDRAMGAGAAAAIALYFWRLVRPSLHVYFSNDDLMNLYRAWDLPLGRLVRANILFWQASPFGRPLACFWYRTIYHWAGFHPGPFHAVLLAMLAVNIWLTYALARRLSGSRAVGAVAALIGCYHDRLASLYFDTGYVYDVLCYLFCLSAMLLYVRARDRGRHLRVWEIAACLALYVCALNSKEMAVSLPLMLLLYEALYHGVEDWRQAALIALAGAVTILFIIGRATGPDSMIHNPAYRPHFTLAQFLLTSRSFLADLTKSYDRFPSMGAPVVWLLTGAIAWASKSRCLRFAWLFLMLAPLPVAFIEPRGPAQYYLPWFGWVLWASAAMVALARKVPAGEVALFATLLAVLYPHFKHIGWDTVASETVDAPENARIVASLHALYPRLPHRARILFLNDPEREDNWNMLFLVRLSYRDRSLEVDCAKRIGRPAAEALARYDRVFDWVDGRFTEPPQVD